MRKVTIAAVQMQCGREVKENIEKADAMVQKAAQAGANVILLPELFERQYFCQERRYDYYSFAKPVMENDAVRHFLVRAKELGVVIPVSFYEKDGCSLYNSVAMIDADGSILGVYRKTHIPDDHYYQEKFYFTPGNTGFRVWDTRFGKVGVGICWDQWFPETARCLALKGAEMLLFPTAIGNELYLPFDSKDHWQRCMQGHAAANVMPVIASNRIGTERDEVNDTEMTFYGSSFITDETGGKIAEANRTDETVLVAELDLDRIAVKRRQWGIFRDRRPDMYQTILTHGI